MADLWDLVQKAYAFPIYAIPAFFFALSSREKYVMATSAPISAHPRAASYPIPRVFDAPMTTTTFPLRLNSSVRFSLLGIEMGILIVQGERSETVEESSGCGLNGLKGSEQKQTRSRGSYL